MIQFNNKARGEFKLSVLRGGEEVSSTPWRPNLITDAGLDALARSGTTGWYYLAVGTGTSSPAYTDTALASQVAQVAGSGWPSNGGVVSGNTCTHTQVFTFALGAVVGNISELGIRSSTGGTLATRALVTDEGGSPTSVTVTAADQLVVTYRVVFTVDQSIQTAVVEDPNSSISYTIQCGLESIKSDPGYYGIQDYPLGNLIPSGNNVAIVGGTFGGPGVSPSGGSALNINFAQGMDQSPAYVLGSFQREARIRFAANVTQLDRDNINILRIRSYVPTEYIKFHFDPPFRKPATYTCELGWVISWGRG